MPLAIGGEDAKPPLTVTYVANEGFIIECPGKKVAIDAFFGGWKSEDYLMPSDSLIELMKTARPPFDNPDLIAITHFHSDHFEAGLVASNMKHNPRTVLICTPQVAEKLGKDEAYAEFSSRIKVIAAPVDSMVAVTVDGIDIEVLPGKHGPYLETDEATGEQIDRHAGVQHLEYLITMCGRTIFHSGDAPLNDMNRYPRLGLGAHKIDLAMVQWFTPRERISFRENLVRETIKPEKIILMHISPGRSFSEPENIKACTEGNIIVPRRSLEKWIIQ